MCRFMLYLGAPLRLSALLLDPEHSLIHQSAHSRERREPTNGDGFGVAWYPQEGGGAPARLRFVTPAWSNANLRAVAPVVSSGCILAHVRAASRGFSAGEANCHPFVSGSLAFMHNGDVGGFPRLRRALLGSLSEAAFEAIEGQTDSEHAFAVFLDHLAPAGPAPGAGELAAALERTIASLVERSRAVDGGESYLNFAVATGTAAAVSRFTTRDGHDGESLYYSRGRRYACVDGVCRMLPAESERAAVIVSSEPLSADPSWRSIPRNHVLAFELGGDADSRPLELARARPV